MYGVIRSVSCSAYDFADELTSIIVLWHFVYKDYNACCPLYAIIMGSLRLSVLEIIYQYFLSILLVCKTAEVSECVLKFIFCLVSFCLVCAFMASFSKF